MTEPNRPSLTESLDAAASPLKRLAAISAQVGLSPIPADAGCHCLCSIYEPHQCEGFRADGCVRMVPAAKLFGRQPPDVEVPVCRSCFHVEVRTG